MTGNEWAISGLSGPPSERLRVALWLLDNTAEVETRRIVQALQQESVGPIRQALERVLADRSGEPSATTSKVSDLSEAIDISDVPHLISHELSAAIGWVKRAVRDQLGVADGGQILDNVSRLERRIDSLVTLLKSEQPLSISGIDLEAVLRRNWPSHLDAPIWRPPVSTTSNILMTDVRLMELILANAFQNAIDATASSGVSRGVAIEWSFTDRRFWIRVSNPFLGSSFSIEDVERVSTTSKRGHQGIGVSLMQRAAARLNYGMSLVGSSGTANLTITGESA